MSTKRQPSKQRRQSQNRQQRAAVQARSDAASTSGVPAGTSTDDATTTTSSGSVLSRLTGSGSSSRMTSSGTKRAAAAGLPPGHRAALTSVMLATASVLFVLFAFRVPISAGTGEPITTKPERVAEWSIASLRAAQGLDAGATADDVSDAVTDWSPGGQAPYVKAFWPMSLALFLPLIGAGLGFRAVSKGASAKVVNRAMYVTLFGALLTTQLLIFFLPAVIALAIAAFQVRKAEVAASPAAADGVIDVDEVDAADEVDEVDPAST